MKLPPIPLTPLAMSVIDMITCFSPCSNFYFQATEVAVAMMTVAAMVTDTRFVLVKLEDISAFRGW